MQAALQSERTAYLKCRSAVSADDFAEAWLPQLQQMKNAERKITYWQHQLRLAGRVSKKGMAGASTLSQRDCLGQGMHLLPHDGFGQSPASAACLLPIHEDSVGQPMSASQAATKCIVHCDAHGIHAKTEEHGNIVCLTA